MKPPEGKPPLRNLDIAEAAFYGFLIMYGVSLGLLMAFQGDTHFPLPLYALGVLPLFAVSRLGMVRRWTRLRERHSMHGLHLAYPYTLYAFLMREAVTLTTS